MTSPADETENQDDIAADGAAKGDEQDDLAAEWGAALGDEEGGGEGGDAGGGATRVLNQDEIDSLLGFDDTAAGGEEQTGIQAVLNSALVSYERLPMLEVVFDRLVRLMS
ncbi:MAG: flagellar motor switch protein FliM, partial [Rhodospirillales bacterium]